MHCDIILFDLDGTLTDSGPGIMKAGQYALRAFGIERDWRELSFFVGPPLSETFARFVRVENVDAAVAKFREYYQQDGPLPRHSHAARASQKRGQAPLRCHVEARHHG